MKVIIFVNADDLEKVEIVTDKNGKRLIFDSREKANNWCEDNAQKGHSYTFWEG